MLTTVKHACPSLTLAIALQLLGMQHALSASDIAADNKPRGLFHVLASKIAEENRLERYDFATLALKEVIQVYETSYLESNNEQPKDHEAQQKLLRWKRGLRSFIDQLVTLKSRISNNSEIDIVTTPSGPVVLYIDDNPVVLSGPEIAKANLIEQRVIEQFCSLHDCSSYRETPVAEPIKAENIAKGSWHLNHKQGARYETPDGLNFVFHTLDEREEKQRRCETLANDLRVLITHLKRASQAGYIIDWKSISISTLHDHQTEHVIINPAGDYLRMDLKSLGMLTQFEEQFLVWVKKRMAQDQSILFITHADKLLDY